MSMASALTKLSRRISKRRKMTVVVHYKRSDGAEEYQLTYWYRFNCKLTKDGLLPTQAVLTIHDDLKTQYGTLYPTITRGDDVFHMVCVHIHVVNEPQVTVAEPDDRGTLAVVRGYTKPTTEDQHEAMARTIK